MENLVGRRKIHTKPSAFYWSKQEEEEEDKKDIAIWREVCQKLRTDLSLEPGELEKLLEKTYGDYHFCGILAMPSHQLRKDLVRTRRLLKEERSERLGFWKDFHREPYTDSDAAEEGLTIVDDLVVEATLEGCLGDPTGPDDVDPDTGSDPASG